MKKKSFIALSALLLVACSSDNEPQIANNMEQMEIKLTAGIESVNSSTRAGGIIDKDYSGELLLSFARIDMDVDGNYPINGYKGISSINATLNDQQASFSTPQYYLARTANNSSRMVCWYPNDALDATTAKVTFDISNGDTDVMLSEDKSGSRTEPFNNTDGKKFTLQHLLTQLKVKVYSPSAEIGDLWGKIQKIEIVDSPTNYIVTFPIDSNPASAYGFASEGSTSISLIASPSEVSIPTGSNPAIDYGYIMIPPCNKILTLKVTAENAGVKTISIPNHFPENGYLASNTYQIILNFLGSTISPTVSIGEWIVDPTENEINVQ